jgi:aminopeptidase-like protein
MVEAKKNERANALKEVKRLCKEFGKGVYETFNYLLEHFLPNGELKSISSGTQVFDWVVPDEWNIDDGYILNGAGEKIVDFKESNLHVMSYSAAVDKIVDSDELLNHIHTLPKYPDRIPYRTSYYNKNWGFCCSHNLLKSEKFFPPFKVFIESSFNSNGNLSWLECVKKGRTEKEILISTYCCHPSLANDNLSGFVLATFLFEYLSKLDTRYTYRLVILPETIGAISFLSQADTKNIIGGMVLSCVAGPDKLSIKEGFDTNHFMTQSAHLAIKSYVNEDYLTYPFVPDGSDERQYSTPGFRIVTPSIHKSKYYEFDEYHTSADDLDFVSSTSLIESLEVHKNWISLIESYCYPKRTNQFCEFQLGKRDLYPRIGGTFNQKAHDENESGNHQRLFSFADEVTLTGAHLNAFHWLMHLADGSISNFDIAKRSKLDITIVNQAIAAMLQKDLLELK